MPIYDKLAICPYYERESAMSVTCEGMTRQVHSAVKFDSGEEKREWFARYCGTYKYGDCPYARMIADGKYREKEEN